MLFPRLPPLNALRAFEAAARLGSFRAAADELGVTHPVIGRHIRNLEERLAVRLFHKAGRGSVLTAQGHRYLARISKAFEEIAEATYEVAPRPSPNRLRLLVAPAFSARWLAPRLGDLARAAPRLSVVLEPTEDFGAILSGHAHVGIGFGDPEQFPGLVQTLSRPEIFPVCSPRFLEEHGPFGSLDDLRQATLNHEDEGSWWMDWFAAQGVSYRPQDRISYANAAQAIDMAVAGRGIALANPFVVERELAAGALVRPTSHAIRSQGYQLVLRPGRHSLQIKAAVEWLVSTVEQFEAAQDVRGLEV